MTARTIVVIGGASGIGLAVVQQAIGEGWRAVVVDRQEPLEPTEARFVRCDLLDAEASGLALEAIAREEECVDALVVTAGGAAGGTFESLDAEAWVDKFANDTITVLRALRLLLPALQAAARAGGIADIAVIGSIASTTAFDRAAVYGAGAAARNSFAEQLRVELRGERIRARTISTGYVETPLTADQIIPAVTERISLAPLQPEDVAAVVLHSLNLPSDVNVHDVVLVPTAQGWA